MITLMEYDFHGFYDGYTGSNAPLYHSTADTEDATKQLNVVSYDLSLLFQHLIVANLRMHQLVAGYLKGLILRSYFSEYHSTENHTNSVIQEITDWELQSMELVQLDPILNKRVY